MAHTDVHPVAKEAFMKREPRKQARRGAAAAKKFQGALTMVHKRFGRAMRKLAK